ncbi:MAG: NAD(P)H dehydrogenase [Alphaproteobacteria bacterium HGW-Alphaproteobacteria-18]|nr:MAG: NAD(P)H dehydrogenase [Alphaproteobacteria bacterium HGW-Alphaproteobacteria-18]
MTQTICIIDGHPDADPKRLCRTLADSYAEGAHSSGYEVSRINVRDLTFPLLERNEDFLTPPPEPVLSERQKIAEADHLVILFPLWLGGMPAKLRAFFEQTARAGFFISEPEPAGTWPRKMMAGKSARVVITMGMPGAVYRVMMDAGSLKALERGILGISGFKPVRHTILGGAGDVSPQRLSAWKSEMWELGHSAA